MELFKLLLPDNPQTIPLYLNGAGSFIMEEDCVRIGRSRTVSLDTFFNLFSHTKYLKYTRVSITNGDGDGLGDGVADHKQGLRCLEHPSKNRTYN